jgi:c-di-GMP-related signal transduction protein
MRDFYVARQPIFNADNTLFAYELLFRDSQENIFPEVCPNEATSRLIDGSFIGGLVDDLTAGKKCFINFTFDSLVKKHPSLLPTETLVIEVLETLRPGKKLLAECIELHKQGYQIALDDYIPHPDWINFFPYIAIIKVDIQQISDVHIAELIKAIQPYSTIKLLAERVETHEQFQHYKALGYSYFQGYFFARPEVLKSRTLSAPQLVVLQLMQVLMVPEPDFDKVTKILEQEVQLAFRLLQYANSAKFKRGKPIDSIKRAVVLLGKKELYKCMSLLFVTQMNDSKPLELAKLSLVRGRFCELLCMNAYPKLSDAAFLTGILSLLDAIFDMPMAKITAKLPLSDEILQALNDNCGLLANFLTMVNNYEKGNWQDCIPLTTTQEISIAQCYNSAVQWAEEQLP